MKSTLFLPALALLGSSAVATWAADPDPKPTVAAESSPAPTKTAPSPGVIPGLSGHAVVEIDVNGKKEKREFNFGNGTAINIAGGSEAPAAKSVERRAWLGVASEEVSDEVRAQLPLAGGAGLIVRGVAADSPAAQAGLAMNDVLVKLDDQILVNAEQLRALVGMKKQGDTVRVSYLRRGHEESVEVKLGSHEVGDVGGVQWKVSDLIRKAGTIELKNLVSPLQIESKAIVIDKDGNLISTDSTEDLRAGAAKLGKTLLDAGVDTKAIEQLRRALKEATDALQKAVGDGTKPNGELNKQQLQEKLQEKLRDIEEARKAAEAAKAKSQPAPPVEKAQ